MNADHCILILPGKLDSTKIRQDQRLPAILRRLLDGQCHVFHSSITHNLPPSARP
jgi:hypothetical protein